jgi:hypothetical protein
LFRLFRLPLFLSEIANPKDTAYPLAVEKIERKSNPINKAFINSKGIEMCTDDASIGKENKG